jgi:hypothetical protein
MREVLSGPGWGAYTRKGEVTEWGGEVRAGFTAVRHSRSKRSEPGTRRARAAGDAVLRVLGSLGGLGDASNG